MRQAGENLYVLEMNLSELRIKMDCTFYGVKLSCCKAKRYNTFLLKFLATLLPQDSVTLEVLLLNASL